MGKPHESEISLALDRRSIGSLDSMLDFSSPSSTISSSTTPPGPESSLPFSWDGYRNYIFLSTLVEVVVPFGLQRTLATEHSWYSLKLPSITTPNYLVVERRELLVDVLV